MRQKTRHLSLEERVELYKKQAEEKGLLPDFIFEELIDDFYDKTKLLNRIKEELEEGELTTTKVYIKEKPNQTPNKLITSYTVVSNARVNVVRAIGGYIEKIDRNKNTTEDPLSDILGGGEE